MINNKQLQHLSSVDMGAINVSELIEINSVPVNKKLPKEARILQYIEDIKNPYCFKVGNNAVRTQFSAAGLSLQNALVKSVIR